MRRFLVAVFVCSLAITAILAQSQNSSISGTVKDTSGTPLSGVSVQLNSLPFSRITTTDESGQYAFRSLPAGAYSLVFSLSGFVTVERVAYQLLSDFNGRVDIEMRVGVGTEIINITSAAPVVDLQTAAHVAALDRSAIDNVPTGKTIPGVGQMILGVSLNAPDVGGSTGAMQTYMSMRGGSVSAANSLMVDGMTVNGMAAAPPVSGKPEFNTEAYDKIDDNRWSDATRQPLSTFSIDVDTASYSNVRRFLNQRQLPPKDAVRIEELVNYFSYGYDQPDGKQPFSITTSIGDCPWNTRHLLALVGIQGKRMDASDTPPRNLVFLVDVSGSMNMPAKLPLVKDSLSLLARNLRGSDRIAIVVYAGAAGLVLPSTEGNDETTILAALNRLQAGGSTNGAQGIRLAYEVARQHFIEGGVNRVVLATDGDFNVGVTNQGDLVRLIEENRETGVSLSVLGFGMGNLKDSTMEKLADKGNGNYFYIDSLTEARKVLVEDAGGTLVTIAKDVKLQIEFNPRVVGAYRLVGYENRVLQDRDFNDDKKDAGELGAGHSVTALYEIVPAGQTIESPGVDPLKYRQAGSLSPNAWTNEAMTVKLRYKAPDGDVSALIEKSVPMRVETTAPLGFASSVAQFGMLLRDSEFKGSSSFASVRALAARYGGRDPYGHKQEFLRLIEVAQELVAGR